MQTRNVPLSFDEAETVAEMSKKLIVDYHPHLINTRIAYLYKNKPMKKGHKIIYATAEKCSVKNQALCKISGGEPFQFVVTINYKGWNELTDAQKLAVLDHELCHFSVEDDPKTGEQLCTLLPHDVEEFGHIIKTHGMYNTDVKNFVDLAPSEKKETKILDRIDGDMPYYKNK